MGKNVMTLGRNSLLSLAGTLEIRIIKLCGKRKTKLFCRKHEALITSSFNEKHHCLKPKRMYENKEGEKVVIFCPHLMTLKGEPFYKENHSIIYETLEACYEITPEFKRRPRPPEETEKKEDLWTRQARTLRSLINAGRVLTSEDA